MQITEVVLFKVHGTYWDPGFPPGDRQAQATDVYPEFNARSWAGASAGPHPISDIYVEIQTDEGVSGLFGPIEEYQAYVIGAFLRPYLVGRDPLATELLHDQMLRLHRHGRSGMFMTGLSPVDCALWDLKGKLYGAPVSELLGGRYRERLRAYASILFPEDPTDLDDVRRNAERFVAAGFTAIKFGWGGFGQDRRQDIALVRTAREALGPDIRLMVDVGLCWGLTTTLVLAPELGGIGLY